MPLSTPESSPRQEAFGKFIEWWREANSEIIEDGHSISREQLASSSAAAGWNAALDWVKERSGL